MSEKARISDKYVGTRGIPGPKVGSARWTGNELGSIGRPQRTANVARPRPVIGRT